MKKFLLVIGLMFIWNICFAEVYVLIDKNTKEIITMSEKNDTILQQGQELITLSGDFETYPLQDHPTNYFYKNNKFIKNIDKIDKQEQEKIKQEEQVKEEKLIQDEIRAQAIKALKDKGIELKHNK